MLPELSSVQTVSSSVEDSSTVVSKVQSRSPASFHLTRSSKNYRAFIPGKGLQVEGDSSWSPYISLSNSDKTAPSVPMTHVPKVILGSTVVPAAKSFLQKVRDAKKVIVQPTSQAMPTGAFVSLSENKDVNDGDQEEPPAQSGQPPKPVKRYFSSLAPLKVKRIRGNPQKEKKKKGK